MTIKGQDYSVNEQGHLEIGGVDTKVLTRTYGTPLFVYDVTKIRENCRSFVDTFKKHGVPFQVSYASKAFSSKAIFQVIKEEGLSLDVVSAGELYTAIKADFPTERIHFHGNNKSFEELEMAVDHDIGCIVLDNFYEIDLLDKILQKYDKSMDVLLRVTPGIESETHAYIMTGNEDSKFGFNLENGQAEEAFQKLQNHSNIRLTGLHSHIGSQIFNTESFVMAVEVLYKQIKLWHESTGFTPLVMNFGGGFGIRYTESDQPLTNDAYIEGIIEKVTDESNKMGIAIPEIWIEPGRSIVGEAGITLYKVGSMKDIQGVRKYVAVDGGMSDNIRPALYDAKYTAIIANKADMPTEEKVSIAGKCCESGDMLVWDVQVPKIEANDIVALFSTGAYGYAMASNYNRLPRPAVVFVENGQHQLVIQRESYEDMLKNDLEYRI